jgi:glycosyltransferase involved in cell wall biosynthesis
VPIDHAGHLPTGRVLIVVPYLAVNDAVGFDTLAIKKCLAAEGWETGIFCGGADDDVREHVLADAAHWLNDPNVTLVYVNASLWNQTEEIVGRFPGRLVMRFHAGPPPGMFQSYDSGFLGEIARYWAQTMRIAPFFDRFLAVSENAAERLAEAGADAQRIRVTGVFHNIDELHRVDPDPEMSKYLDADPRKVVLTVSRMGAQKGQADIVKIAKNYLDEHPRGARFLLVGGCQPDGYAEHVVGLIHDLGLDRDVHLPRKTGPGGLRVCYERADAMLSMSRSESFCVPIIEAQSFGVPVIARASMAVPDTMGAGGILIDEIDFATVAHTLHSVLHDEKMRERLVRAGMENVERFATDRIARAVIDGISSAGAPVKGQINGRQLRV